MIGKTNSSIGGKIKGEKLNISLATNQAVHNDLIGAVITVTHPGGATNYTWEGDEITVEIPPYVNYSVSYSAVNGYKTPVIFTAASVADNSRNIIGTYQTEIVTVTANASNNSDMSGQVITINGTKYTWVGTAISVKIPYGTTYTISASDKEGYTTPVSQTFTASQSARDLLLQYVYNPAKDLSMYDIYGLSISQTTANCYVVSQPGQYKFPLVFGNALKNGKTNSAAYTKNSGSNSHDFVDYNGTAISSPYIETVSGVASSVQLSITDTDGVFTDISITSGTNCRYVQFTVKTVPTTGANGIISIKDGNGVIMWNWHVWVWKDDLTTVAITNSTGVTYNILPVNLASKWDSANKSCIKNWYCQFGRPTLLLCSESYDSNSNHACFGELPYTVEDLAIDIKDGIRKPHVMFANSDYSSNFNWYKNNYTKFYNLWDANNTTTGLSDNTVVKTVYDPCPIGFHVPNGNIFTYFSLNTTIGGFNYGYYFKRNANDAYGVFFPASGNRNYSTGEVNAAGEYGIYWLSAIKTNSYAARLTFHDGVVSPQENWIPRTGYSIRPVKE